LIAPPNMIAMTALKVALDVFKKIVSSVLTLGGLALICYGIFTGQAVLTSNTVVPFILFLAAVTLLGYLEGLQVAILALEGQDGEPFRKSHPRAYWLHSLVNKPMNVQRFLVGRQFFVIFNVMLISQCSTFPDLERPSWFPQPLWVVYVDTALYGALCVLAFGQLMPQLIGARHAVAFCNLPGSPSVLCLTLFCEATGIAHFAWVLTDMVLRMAGMRKTAKEVDLESGDVLSKQSKQSNHNKAIEAMAHILGNWKTGQMQDFAVFCEKMKDDNASETSTADSERVAVVTSRMALDGLRDSGCKGTSDLLQCYEATPKGEEFAHPREIAEKVLSEEGELPCFLLPPSHPLHVPPHIVAFWLMSKAKDV